MTNTVVTAIKPTTIPAKFANLFVADVSDLSEGVAGGFTIVSFRGSKWRIKHKGEEILVTDAEGEAKPSLELVLLKASKAVSKMYYLKPYEEGSDEAPDCMSVDGITPDPGVPNKQADSCAACPRNVWGSKITPAGKKAKACADSRRIAVAPAGDIANEQYGGPMLIRVPAASLDDLAKFGKQMAAKGYPYNAIVTRIGFDPDASYPKLTFKAVRALKGEELEAVASHLTNADSVARILTETNEITTTEPVAAVDTEFEVPPETAPEKEKPAKGAKAAAGKASAATQKPPAETSKSSAASQKATGNGKDADGTTDAASGTPVSTAMDKELDDILADLDTLG